MNELTELALYIDGKCRVQSGLTPHGNQFVQTADQHGCRADLNRVLRMFFSASNDDRVGSVTSGRVELRWYETSSSPS